MAQICGHHPPLTCLAVRGVFISGNQPQFGHAHHRDTTVFTSSPMRSMTSRSLSLVLASASFRASAIATSADRSAAAGSMGGGHKITRPKRMCMKSPFVGWAELLSGARMDMLLRQRLSRQSELLCRSARSADRFLSNRGCPRHIQRFRRDPTHKDEKCGKYAR